MSENNFNSETRVDGGNSFSFETEIVTNENGKKAIKVSKLSKKQKDALLSSGVAFAGLAAGAGAFTMLSFTDAPEGAPVVEVTGDETVMIELDTPVAENASGALSFNQAFANARAELGPGGLFVWEGDLYHTYTASEWNNMSEAERLDFTSSVSVQNPTASPASAAEPVAPVENNSPDAEPEVIGEPQTSNENAGNEELEIVGYDLDNDGVADLYVFDLDENGAPDVLIDASGDGVYDQIIMNVDFESDAPMEEYDTLDVEIYPEDLEGVEVISVDRGEEAANVSAQDNLVFDEFADNDVDINFDNDADVSDFI
jgi:hypothetical protein